MSDKMTPIPFHKLMERAMNEYTQQKEIFGISDFYRHEKQKGAAELFGQSLEVPFGPAAGPHTQLAQNLLASYAAGCRFFELKTVQILDGDDLHVEKPCIRADYECYNVEWSTELYTPQAFAEYVKGWYAIKLLAKEYDLGDPEAFLFNMSVGYDLKGIQSEKIDRFIEGMKNAKDSDIWKECEAWALANVNLFEHVDETYVRSISPEICNSITLSTMHGCPRHEIESIIEYLLREKKINTYLKCNPTLLGYEFVRKTLDDMGYGYMDFDTAGFETDLQYPEAVALLGKMQKLAGELGLSFGVKLSNTFHVKIRNNELPGEDMYMSGKALYPLTIHLAAKLAEEFEGNLPISFSGGADAGNIQKIYETGIWPVTVATVLLRPAGYKVIKRLVGLMNECERKTSQTVDVEAVKKLAADSLENTAYRKSEEAAKAPLAVFAGQYENCASCKVTCGTCVNVCPNRANTTLHVDGTKRILHMDSYCNECGNCFIFCPDKTAPYKARMTYFVNKTDLYDSTNDGFALLDDGILYRYGSEVKECAETEAPAEIRAFAAAIREQKPYLI